MRRSHVFSFALAVLLSASLSSYSQTQTSFELEGSVDSPVAIPADVIAVLKSDERVDRCFNTDGAGTNEVGWFEAAEYDLNGDGRRDLIVKPKNPCLFGANQGPFWIFQNVPDGYQKIFAADGMALNIMPRKVNRFNTIQIGKAVRMRPVNAIFHFSQGKYRAAK